MSIQPASKRLLRRCIVGVVIILFCSFICRMGHALYHNNQLHTQFSETENISPYQQEVPIEEIDLTVYNDYFPQVFALIDLNLTSNLETPVTLRYYTEIPTKDTAAAFEIAKGTTIIAIPEWSTGSQLHDLGYGYTSYPTYERGWRYVRPFLTAGGEVNVESKQYYYVKLGSLESVLGKVIAENKSLQSAGHIKWRSILTGKHTTARYIDNTLYQHGVYLSPDLSRHVIDFWSILLLIAIGILLAIVLLHKRIYTSHRSKHSTGLTDTTAVIHL